MMMELTSRRNQKSLITMTEDVWCSAIQRYLGSEYRVISIEFKDASGQRIDAPFQTVATVEIVARTTPPPVTQQQGVFRSMVSLPFLGKAVFVLVAVNALYWIVKPFLF